MPNGCIQEFTYGIGMKNTKAVITIYTECKEIDLNENKIQIEELQLYNIKTKNLRENLIMKYCPLSPPLSFYLKL